jgi:hypothetical protein
MEVCYWALLFMPLVILHHLLDVSVQLANKRGFKQQKKFCGGQITASWQRYKLLNAHCSSKAARI